MGYPPTHRQRAREMHEQGKSLAEIAKELGVASRTTVRMWLLPEKCTAQHNTAQGAAQHIRKNHSQSKGQIAKALASVAERVGQELEQPEQTEQRPTPGERLDEISRRPSDPDPEHPALSNPLALAERLEKLAWDLTDAGRAAIAYGDPKIMFPALKICVETSRLIRGRATSIQETLVVATEGEQRREQLVGRVRGLHERLRERASAAGIQGIVEGDAAGRTG